MLKDGKYSAILAPQFKHYPNYSFEISNGNYYFNENGNVKKYKIIQYSPCSFRLEDYEIIDTTKMTKLQKMFSKQKPFYDIYKVRGKTYYFVFRADMRVQIFAGKFIRNE